MNKGIRFTDEFKQDAVAQVVERGYAVSEVAERLGISTKSLYTWKAQFAKSPRLREIRGVKAKEEILDAIDAISHNNRRAHVGPQFHGRCNRVRRGSISRVEGYRAYSIVFRGN